MNTRHKEAYLWSILQQIIHTIDAFIHAYMMYRAAQTPYARRQAKWTMRMYRRDAVKFAQKYTRVLAADD